MSGLAIHSLFIRSDKVATAIYMRVSTERQEETGVSLQTQKERLHAYCTMKGFTNVKEYLDVGSGRTTENRINFKRMLEDVECGFIKNVVILKLDRLTRSIIDLNKLVSQLNEHNCELHSCTENIDTTTASGRMMMNLIGTFAQWESETISERVKVNMQSLAEKGVWQSSVPYGFNLGDDKRLEVNEEEKEHIKQAFDLVIQGNSFTHAENKISNKYNLNWHKGFLLKKLRSPSTVGDMYRNETTIENTHPPLITRQERDKLLSIANERHSPRMQIFQGDLFRRKVVCPYCAKIMSLRANKSERDNSNLYSYNCHHCYRNKGKTPTVSELRLEDAFVKYLERISISYDKEDIKTTDKEKEINNLKMSLRSLEEEKKRIQKAWIKGFMEDDDLVEHQKEVDNKVLEIENKLSELTNQTFELTTDDILNIQTTLRENYEHMTKDEKITFIQSHIKEIHFTRKLLKGYKKKYSVNVDTVVFY